ncbi:SCO3242 family prenyltransferase [Catenulispora rubra]|uniref:SCO3242 family prenyltransferase n=1 Tax=Catenulispora rubra TaxID=280293 RepID=UPI0018927E2E|nr:UbiA family prenyltransferase [Catenulispora rubra]
MADTRALVELLRAPAAFSVPGDVFAGAAAAGRPIGARACGTAAASVCLYWAGMALNDHADRFVDVFERPERPLPSGRVRPGTALAIAGGLTAAGLGIAALSGGVRTLTVAVPLAAAVWGYDLAYKDRTCGPAVMAAARSLDVLMGAGVGALRAAAPAAAVVGAHTLAVTVLSRGEVHGASRRVAATTAALSGTAAGGALAVLGRGRRSTPRPQRAFAAALAGLYTWRFGGAQAAVARDGRADVVRKAVGAGIMSLMPLQASLIAGRGEPLAALPIAAAGPLARRLARTVSPT